ncbi:MAG: hypothetical protein FWD61_08395, partial [Phycisphaerales bacterium]|nr:hypothetical protein [Phycisphaerales bacterium]
RSLTVAALIFRGNRLIGHKKWPHPDGILQVQKLDAFGDTGDLVALGTGCDLAEDRPVGRETVSFAAFGPGVLQGAKSPLNRSCLPVFLSKDSVFRKNYRIRDNAFSKLYWGECNCPGAPGSAGDVIAK